jgi:hypothetical protein
MSTSIATKKYNLSQGNFDEISYTLWYSDEVGHYSSRLPQSWVTNQVGNAIFAGMYQSEAMWLNFEGANCYLLLLK